MCDEHCPEATPVLFDEVVGELLGFDTLEQVPAERCPDRRRDLTHLQNKGRALQLRVTRTPLKDRIITAAFSGRSIHRVFARELLERGSSSNLCVDPRYALTNARIVAFEKELAHGCIGLDPLDEVESPGGLDDFTHLIYLSALEERVELGREHPKREGAKDSITANARGCPDLQDKLAKAYLSIVLISVMTERL